MFEKLVMAFLHSWLDADTEQVEAWAKGEAWSELQALAQCKAAQPTLAGGRLYIVRVFDETEVEEVAVGEFQVKPAAAKANRHANC